MYLKSLELHGFKSFPNRTVLTFERGATVIVGPNGSGKSNISDAMRWVLGELSSRNIRGTRMVDVIFGGTDDRRPMGFAEVSVTFDNTDPENRLDSDFEEVTVTRRYYRTGESEYLINKEQKRLRDIHMLFMNTGVGREGYSIIGQGKVAEIVSKKSDERRNIFEEAAGISKFRYRKEEAEKKLNGVSENIDRINDIRLELENRVGPLEKEAEKARRGLAIFEEKKKADVSLWLYDTKQIREEIEEADKAWRLSVHELEIAGQIIKDLELQIEALYEKAQTYKHESADLLEQIQNATKELYELDNKLKVAESDYAHSAELINDANARIVEINNAENTLLARKSELVAKRGKCEEVLTDHNDKRLEFLAEQQNLTNQINELNNQLNGALDDITVETNVSTDLKIRMDVLDNARVSDGSKSEEIEAEIAKYEADGVELKNEADRCEANASGFKKQIAEKEAIISESQEKIDGLTEEKSQINDRLHQLKLQQDTAKQRADILNRMNEHFEGFAGSVKFVMTQYKEGRIPGAGEIYGPLSSIINVNKDYIIAIETALGSSLQNIVVDNEDTATSCIQFLKDRKAGRVTLYPLTSIRAATENDEIRMAKKLPGFIGRADTLVNADDKYKVVIEHLLLRTLVFDNIQNATSAAKRTGFKVKIVTLDGQLINAGGSFTGGSPKQDSGMLSRSNEIAQLKEKSDKLGKEIKETVDALANIDEELKTNHDIMRTAEQDRDLLLTLSRSQFAALDNATAKYNANCDIINKFKMDLKALQSGRERAEEELIEIRANYRASQERLESLKKFRENKSLEMGALDELRDQAIEKANGKNISIAEVRKEIEGLDGLIASADGRLEELEAERTAQEERKDALANKSGDINKLKAQHKIMYDEINERREQLTKKRVEVEAGGDEFEKQSNEIRQRQKEKNASYQTLTEYSIRNENKLAQLKEKQERLGSQLWEDYEITYERAVELNYPPVTAENRDEVAAIQTSCRSKLRSIGNFNPNAIEEYADVKTRYDDLNAQYMDLSKSKEDTIGIIARIEEEMRSHFLQAFNDINKHFAVTFKELFGGGSAELSLTEPEDVLTSGIEIKAAPPGKIIKSMSLLSGGEQSFVAIALLFAILKVNPTPFCILDEIEAALDEVNVFRFGEYVKKLCDDTQFILITHRRGTMEIGDRLYGVTMPQRGISQAIELNVNEIEGKQKELLDGIL